MQLIQKNPKYNQHLFDVAKRLAEGLPPLIQGADDTLMTILNYHGTAIAQVFISSCPNSPYELHVEDVWNKFKDFYSEADSFITTDTEHRDDCHFWVAQK